MRVLAGPEVAGGLRAPARRAAARTQRRGRAGRGQGASAPFPAVSRLDPHHGAEGLCYCAVSLYAPPQSGTATRELPAKFHLGAQ